MFLDQQIDNYAIKTSKALQQFSRPVRLDLWRLFDLALLTSSTHCLQIIVRAKLVDRRRMVDKVLASYSISTTLEAIRTQVRLFLLCKYIQMFLAVYRMS